MTEDSSPADLSVGTVFNDEHLVLGGAEGELPDGAAGAELLRRELLEAGHNAAISGDGDQLDLGAWSHGTYC